MGIESEELRMSLVPVITRPGPLRRRVPHSTGRLRTAPRTPTAKRKSKAQAVTKSDLTITNFVIIVGIVYLVGSLSGQVMVEKARREGIAASQRASEARKVVEELNHRLAALKDLPAVEGWAKTHNFFLPDQLALKADGKDVAQQL